LQGLPLEDFCVDEQNVEEVLDGVVGFQDALQRLVVPEEIQQGCLAIGVSGNSGNFVAQV